MSPHKSPISQVIRERILSDSRTGEGESRYFANQNISEYIEEGELSLLVKEVEQKVSSLLESLIIDPLDHNSADTPARVARMLIRETLSGRYTKQPKVTDFPNVSNYDQIYHVGPVRVTSLCSHHHQPISGYAHLGIYPSKRVIGLSKFERLTDWIMRRPQIQEEATIMLADLLEKVIHPKGLALVVKASHGCCSNRGIMNKNMLMTTSVMRGAFLESMEMRSEFFNLVNLS